MNNSQRAAAERLVDNMNLSLETWIEQAENLLRELLAEPVQEPIARLHDDGHFSWQSYEARRQFDSKHEYEGWAMDVYAAPQQRRSLACL